MSDSTSQPVPSRQIIPIPAELREWIEPWYLAYAILGALASGLAVIAIPVVVTSGGGGAGEIGAAIAAQNVGVIFAPAWGWLADRTRSYRAVFFAGFVLIALGFLGFALLNGLTVWLGAAFLIGFGTGASNTVAALFVVEFTPKTQWTQRIGWLQTFNAVGSVFGMAFAGLLAARTTTLIAALLSIAAIGVGRYGLPVPGSQFHLPNLRLQMREGELASLIRHGGPNAATVLGHLHRPKLANMIAFARSGGTGFTLFLAGWFCFSFAVSSFGTLYPVLMQSNFSIDVARSAMIMSVATAISIPLYNVAGRLASSHGPVTSLRIGIAARMGALAGLALLAGVHVDWIVLPVIALFGSYQGIWPLLSVASNDLAADLARFGEGTAMGLFNATAAVASAFGAVAGGQVAAHFGYSAVSFFASAGALVALACTVRLRGSASSAAPAS